METNTDNTAAPITRKTKNMETAPSVDVPRLVRPLTADEKLKLIEDPARRAINQLRIRADDNTLGICDEGQCSMSNLALWLEGVLDENPGYMPWCSETARVKLAWPNASVEAHHGGRVMDFAAADGRGLA